MNLKERNEKIIKKVVENSPEMQTFRRGFSSQFGVDPFDGEKLPFLKEGFSFKKLKEKLDLREADSGTVFPQFLRAGVQTITNAAYLATPVSYTDWVTVVPSTKDTELYAPNHGVAFPRQVGPNEIYPEVGVAALDLKLQNKKFGAVFACEYELFQDDQTGSIQRQASLLGEYMAVLAEVLVMGKLASASNMKYADYSIPVSETKPSNETNYPFSTSLVGGGANRPSSYAVVNQANIQAGFVGLMNQKNLQGLKMAIAPNRLLIGPASQFDSSVLAHSAFYPSGAATAGNVGGAFAINPIKGLFDITVSRFMFKNDGTVTGDSKAWYLMDDKKPFFVLQQREAVTVVQEAPNTGDNFVRDVIRYKARSRMNADYLDPRFCWRGNDGSAT